MTFTVPKKLFISLDTMRKRHISRPNSKRSGEENEAEESFIEAPPQTEEWKPANSPTKRPFVKTFPQLEIVELMRPAKNYFKYRRLIKSLPWCLLMKGTECCRSHFFQSHSWGCANKNKVLIRNFFHNFQKFQT